MPPSTGSLFAVCCRCRLRAVYASRACVWGTRAVQPSRFSTSPILRHNSAVSRRKKAEAPLRDLIILEPLLPRRADVLPPTSHSPLDNTRLDELSKSVLTFEREAVMDATQMEISLLRPTGQRVSKQRFEQLRDQLAKAFNPVQLRTYYESEIHDGPVIPKIRRNANKRDVITAILKDRWGVMIAEEIAEREDVITNKEINTTRRDIFFLIGHDGLILRDWAHRCFARITVDVANAKLHIQASQASIERIEGLLADMVKNVVSENVEFSALSRVAQFNDENMVTVARITNTFVERLDNHLLRISGLGPNLEHIHDARRLLLTSIDLRLRTKDILLYNPPIVREDQGAIYPVAEAFALPWAVRDRDWGRFKFITPQVTPLKPPLNTTIEVLRRAKAGKGKHYGRLESVPAILTELGGTVSEELRARGLVTNYEASLGQILYNADGNSEAMHVEDFVREFGDKQKILCAVFPGIPAFAQDPIGRTDFEIPPPPLTGVSATEYFQLKFMPSPWFSPESFEHYPPIRMTVEINTETGEPHSPKLFALSTECNADAMLPSQPCDIRFSRRDEGQLSVQDDIETAGGGGGGGGVQTEEWNRFLADSHLNPSKDVGLRASPTLMIHIPDWMVDRAAALPSKTKGPVEYVFTGLEYRHSIDLEENGSVLSRTAVEGGISGGRRTEVKLRYRPPSSSSSSSLDDRNGTDLSEPEADPGFVAFVSKALSLVSSVERYVDGKHT